MVMISQANLDVANTTINTAVNAIFNNKLAPTWNQFTATQTAPGTSIEIVAVDGLPQIRERVAGAALVHGNLRAYKKNLAYRQWEMTFDLPRILVENDQSGVVGERVRAFASRIPTAVDKIVIDALIANTITGYDGQALLSNSHPNVNGTTADNLQTGAITWAMMRTVTEAMGDLTDENGEPLGIRPSHLLVGPALRRTARELAGDMRPVAIGDASAVDAATAKAALGFVNYDGQELTVIESPRITGNEYVFFALNQGTMPFFLGEFTKLRMLQQTTEASDAVYERDTYSWSIQGDLAPCPFAWHCAHGSVTA